MNWRILSPLAILGPLMGVLMVAGAFPKGVDRFAWLMVALASAYVVARREPARALRHGALIGFWNGASATLIQALYSGVLLANNPWIASAFADQPRGFDMEFFLFMLVPFIGVTAGALTALLSILFVRLLKSR
jgi:hypothetical protein